MKQQFSIMILLHATTIIAIALVLLFEKSFAGFAIPWIGACLIAITVAQQTGNSPERWGAITGGVWPSAYFGCVALVTMDRLPGIRDLFRDADVAFGQYFWDMCAGNGSFMFIFNLFFLILFFTPIGIAFGTIVGCVFSYVAPLYRRKADA